MNISDHKFMCLVNSQSFLLFLNLLKAEKKLTI
jgi:hypothetical protein